MAFLPLFSGEAYPRGRHHETITLMEYTNNYNRDHPRPARKYCYIVKCGDLQKIFDSADVPFTEDRGPKNSFWNRHHPVEDEEYGVEICEDDSGDPNSYCNPAYLVYRRHFMFGRAESQRQIYGGAITPDKAVRLDKQLRNHDISGLHPNCPCRASGSRIFQ